MDKTGICAIKERVEAVAAATACLSNSVVETSLRSSSGSAGNHRYNTSEAVSSSLHYSTTPIP
jgi:hypothetical protein